MALKRHLLNGGLNYAPSRWLLNTLYEKGTWEWQDRFNKAVTQPEASFRWRMYLESGDTVVAQVRAGDPRSWEFVRSYQWHDPGLRHVEWLVHLHHPGNHLFLDIGANLGIRSLVALRAGRPTIMFEPNPALESFTREVCQLNGFEPVALEHLALSDRNGSATFHISSTSYLSSLDGAWAERDGATEQLTVMTRRLDDYLAEHAPDRQVGIIKVDVEGHENEVLTGADETIRRWKPTLLLEIQPSNLEGSLGFVTNHGYYMYVIPHREGRPLRRLQPGACAGIRENNFMACHSESLPNFLQ